jgi:hypothetical protein
MTTSRNAALRCSSAAWMAAPFAMASSGFICTDGKRPNQLADHGHARSATHQHDLVQLTAPQPRIA